MLLSSTHTENSFTTDESKKSLMILHNNQRKGAVDMFDIIQRNFHANEKL